jgi:hypothetical protein
MNMDRVVTTLRLALPNPRPSWDGYDVDALAIEFDTAADGIGWRLELGKGLDIFWVLPTETYDRLRLVHVDSAVRFVDEPTLVADPCLITLDTVRWPEAHLGVVRSEKGDRTLMTAQLEIKQGVFAVDAMMLCTDGKRRGYRCRTIADED